MSMSLHRPQRKLLSANIGDVIDAESRSGALSRKWRCSGRDRPVLLFLGHESVRRPGADDAAHSNRRPRRHECGIPKVKVPRGGYVKLQEMILGVRRVLRQIAPVKIDGCEAARWYSLSVSPFPSRSRVENSLLSFSLPNFYFHAVTTCEVLRMNGVPIGKVGYFQQVQIINHCYSGRDRT